jgi:hypothetical protein
MTARTWLKRTWYDTGAASGDLCGWSDWTPCSHAEALAIEAAADLYAQGLGSWPAAQALQAPAGLVDAIGADGAGQNLARAIDARRGYR